MLQADTAFSNPNSDFVLYLKRHIELDGEEHSKAAAKMLEGLCGNDEKKWKEVIDAGRVAIESRIKLWDGIYQQIKTQKL